MLGIILNRYTNECELTTVKVLQFKAEVNSYMGDWLI